jgi:hypothetical protein
MTANRVPPKRAVALSFVLAFACAGVSAQADPPEIALLKRALQNELHSVQESQHPMRYQLRKSSPRLTTTKEIFETRDGAVARLVAIDDKPLGSADAQKEQARLNELAADPGKQHHRKQTEADDTARVLTVLRALPFAFAYQFAGEGNGPTGKVEKFTFSPNPAFDPADLETQALTAMSGEMWVDPAQERVTRLEGHLQRDVDFGWGILGRLYKGGWIVIDQADVADHQWRIVHFQMVMSGRVVFRTRSFDTTEEESRFTSVPVGLPYTQAIQILQNEPATVAQGSR